MAKEVDDNFEIQNKLLPALVEAYAGLAPRRELLDDIKSRREQCMKIACVPDDNQLSTTLRARSR